MRAAWWLLAVAALAVGTLWFIAGGRLDLECLSGPERAARTARGEAVCVERFP